jgi:uncharacterized membrane protein
VRAVRLLFAAVVAAQVGYPLTPPAARAALVVVTVVAGFALSVTHAAVTRGPAVAGTLVAVTGLGGLLAEVAGVHTGVPFGSYAYTAALGPRLFGVPLVIPLAWTWMAWPAWLAAGRVRAAPVAARVTLAGVGLAAWDLFLDPRMVDQGYWRWYRPDPALPGVPGVPVGNYLGWLVVATAMMALLAAAARRLPGLAGDRGRADLPMLLFYLWTYVSSVLAGAVFLGLPGAAAWTALGMAVPAVPLAVVLLRRPDRTAVPGGSR